MLFFDGVTFICTGLTMRLQKWVYKIDLYHGYGNKIK